MLSNLTVAGIVTSLIVCLGLATAASVAAYKFKGNAGGALMAFIFGFAAVMVANQASNVIFSVSGLAALADGRNPLGKVIAGCLLYAVLFTAIEFGIRYYLLFYLEKTGLGKYKGFSLSCGYVVGATLPSALNLILYTIYAFAIKNGSFVDDTMKETEGYENAVAFQNNLINAPTNQYFAFALQFVAIACLHIFFMMYMTRGWLENNKLKSSITVAGIAMAFNGIRELLNAVSGGDNAIITMERGYFFCILLYLLTTAVAVSGLIKTMQNYPQGRERFIKSMRQRAEEQQVRARRSTWEQVNMLNQKHAEPSEEQEDENSEE